MYDLDGKQMNIVTDDEIESNIIDDFENTIDLTEIIREVNENE